MSTGHIKLWWSVKKQPDSFNIYHSLSPFSPTNLPVPIATGLSATTREFRHLDQEHQYDHYYRIASVKNGRLYVSRGVLVKKKPAMATALATYIDFTGYLYDGGIGDFLGLDYSENTYAHFNVFCKVSFIIDGTETAPQYLLYNNESNMALPRELIAATSHFFEGLGMYVSGDSIGSYGLGGYGTLNLDVFNTLNLGIGGELSTELMKFGKNSEDILVIPIEEKTPCDMKIHRLTSADITAMQDYFIGLGAPNGDIDFPIDYYLMLQKYVPMKNQALEDEGYSQAIDTGDAILLRAMAIQPPPPPPSPDGSIPILIPVGTQPE